MAVHEAQVHPAEALDTEPAEVVVTASHDLVGRERRQPAARVVASRPDLVTRTSSGG